MITFTDTAKQKVLSYLEADNQKGRVLRVTIKTRTPDAFVYGFFLDELKNKKESDQLIDMNAFQVLVDAESARHLKGSTIDWVESVNGSGFSVQNPNSPRPSLDDPKAQTIQNLLDKEINPGVGMHGGFVELVGVDGDRVYLKMQGGCQGCGQANVTLRQGIEVRIKEMVPEIKEIIDVTDHQSGTNPYYA